MHKLVTAIGATALAGVLALTAATPASADAWGWPRSHYYQRVYPAYPVYPGYYPGYYPRYPAYDPGAAIAAGIIGGIFGAIAGTAIHGSSHVARCARAYRTYDPASNTYIARPGVRRACRL